MARTLEELQTENHNLRIMLWLAAQQVGGTLTIPKHAVENFNPVTSRLEFKTWLDGPEAGAYFFEAITEEQST